MLLKKKLVEHFEKSLQNQDRQKIQKALLIIYFKEPAEVIRKTIGYLIATIFLKYCTAASAQGKEGQTISYLNIWKDLFV